MDIRHDDWKRIYKELRLTPKQWLELQRANYGRVIYHDSKINIYKCSCRSVWCKDCARNSPTNKTISERLRCLDYRKVRHVILTVDRQKTPAESFALIRQKKAVNRLLTRLNRLKGRVLGRYLWVLEFHRGGYPHWHLLVESEGGMIGKTAIESRWEHGLVWESYIKSESHWGAISGYHKKKGYLAGENKAHQLELPDYLIQSSRVRKFGANFKTKCSTWNNHRMNDSKSNDDAQVKPTKARRKRTRSYEERFKSCDSFCKICVNNSIWFNVPLNYACTKEFISSRADQADYKTFHGDSSLVIDLADTMWMGERDSGQETAQNSRRTDPG